MMSKFSRTVSRGIILIGIVAMAWAEQVIAQNAPPGPPPGDLVDVGGHRLHIHCTGAASPLPTVVFESGGGGTAKDWSRVRQSLRPEVRTCAYDRAGSGWSEAGPSPRTLR